MDSSNTQRPEIDLPIETETTEVRDICSQMAIALANKIDAAFAIKGVAQQDVDLTPGKLAHEYAVRRRYDGVPVNTEEEIEGISAEMISKIMEANTTGSIIFQVVKRVDVIAATYEKDKWGIVTFCLGQWA